MIIKKCDDIVVEFYDNRDYERCIEMGKSAYRSFLKIESINPRYLWVSLIMVARGYVRLNKHDEAIKYALWALRYAPTKDKRIEGLWTLAESYAISKKYELSKTSYEEIFNYYKITKDDFMLGRIYNSKSWYFNDLELAYEALCLLNNVNPIDYEFMPRFQNDLEYAIENTKDTINHIKHILNTNEQIAADGC